MHVYFFSLCLPHTHTLIHLFSFLLSLSLSSFSRAREIVHKIFCALMMLMISEKVDFEDWENGVHTIQVARIDRRTPLSMKHCSKFGIKLLFLNLFSLV